MLIKIIFLSFLVLLNCYAVERSGSYKYHVDKNAHFKLIYDDLTNSELKWSISQLKKMIGIYEKSFNWKLDENVDIVISSNANQISNGFATSYPHLQTVFFRGGIESLDRYAFFSWGELLLIHETAHLFQTNLKRGLSQYTHMLFGNNIYGPFPALWFTLPNMVLPRFIIEGNAVYNESRFSKGGRLSSGEIKASVYNLAKNNVLNYKRILNDYLKFPFGGEKYWLGGYFFKFLEEKYGQNLINKYFFRQAEHYLNPLIINSTFKEHFGTSLENLLNLFFKNLYEKSKNQNIVKGQLISKGNALYNTMSTSSDNSKIYINLGNKSEVQSDLLIIDKENEKINLSKEFDLSSGRVFNINNTFYSNSSKRINSSNIKISLWDNKGSNLESFNNYYVSDNKNKKFLKINANKSFKELHCLDTSNKPFKCHSIPLIDKEGNYYYFLNKNDYRYLYRNKTKLCKISDPYSKVTDIINKNEIWFISSSKLGSTLYSCKNKKVFRLSDSDVIVDAKFLKDEKAVVAQIEKGGYRYDIIKIKSLDSKSSEVLPIIVATNNPPIKNKEFDSMIINSENYYSFTNMRFDSFNFQIFQTNTSSLNDFTLNLSDSLSYSSLYLNYHDYHDSYFKNDIINDKWIALNYLGNGTLLDFNIGVRKNIKSFFEYNIELGIPLYKKSYTSFSLIPKIEFQNNLDIKSSISSISLKYRYSKSKAFSFFAYNSFTAKYLYGWDHKMPESSLSFSKANALNRYVYWESIFSLKYSKNKDISFYDDSISNNSTSYINQDFSSRFKNEFAFVFKPQMFSTWLPLGLRRLAPYINIDSFYDKIEKSNISTKIGIGTYSELILIHNYPAIIKFGINKYISSARSDGFFSITSNF